MALVTIGAESLTLDDTAGGIGFTASKITTKVIRAMCRLEQGQTRVQTTPGLTLTAGGSEGSQIIEIGEAFYVWGQPDMLSFKGIRTGGTSGVLRVSYQGEGGS